MKSHVQERNYQRLRYRAKAGIPATAPLDARGRPRYSTLEREMAQARPPRLKFLRPEKSPTPPPGPEREWLVKVTVHRCVLVRVKAGDRESARRQFAGAPVDRVLNEETIVGKARPA